MYDDATSQKCADCLFLHVRRQSRFWLRFGGYVCMFEIHTAHCTPTVCLPHCRPRHTRSRCRYRAQVLPCPPRVGNFLRCSGANLLFSAHPIISHPVPLQRGDAPQGSNMPTLRPEVLPSLAQVPCQGANDESPVGRVECWHVRTNLLRVMW